MMETTLMPYLRTLSAAALALASAGTAAADPCSAVVDDTVAELRAGASAAWSPDVELLVRTAAGAACVKANSGRYGAAADLVPIGEAKGYASGETGTVSVQAADPSNAEGAEDADEDEEGFSIGGLKIRGASGSPAKKPYERARDGD
jgi:hypothetical protein